MAETVVQWLASLELGHLEREFAANGIDWDLLSDLTNDDLKDIGVSRFADRKKILKAIAELSPQEKLAAEPVAERRQITVAFVDMVDSTGLSGRLDPEDYHNVLVSYQEVCSAVVARYRGKIARLLGDGILIYFGYPRATEDDARRAILSCLEMQQAIAGLSPLPDFKFRARMGIATGTVVVADINTENLSEEGVISGDTPIMAARLQSIAEPDAILVASSTRRLASDLFEYEDAGLHNLKGIERPEHVWRVIAESAAESRQAHAYLQGGGALLGRQSEMRDLQAAWTTAMGGSGTIAVLTGDAGIGKSHLVYTFCSKIEKQDARILRLFCSQFHQHSALYPIIVHLEAAAEIQRADGPDERLRKLGTFLANLTDQAETQLPLFASLLSIVSDSSESAPDLSAERRKELTLQGLEHLLANTAANQPVVLVVEDIHWIDPTTKELLARLTNGLSKLPILLVITCRPDVQHPWSDRDGVTSITLSRLSAPKARAVVRLVAGETRLARSIVDEIISRADGVPLYLEELTKSVLELGANQASSAKGEIAHLPRQVPTSLYESLMERVDRLLHSRDTVLLASVIGRSFTFEHIRAISSLDPATLERDLKELGEAALILCVEDQPVRRYEFRHSLVQELCYQSLVRGRRAGYHGRVAEALEFHFPEIVHTQPEIIARHFSEAGEPRKAIQYWEDAGTLAARRSATIEAISHFQSGLNQIDQLPEGGERDELKLTFLVHHGAQLLAAHGFAAPDVQETYRAAMDLCRATAGSPKLLPVYWGLWGFNIVRVNLPEAASLGEDFLALAVRLADPVAQNAARYALGVTAFYSGEFATAMGHFDAGLDCYDAARRLEQQEFYGQDLAMGCYSYQSWIRSLTGDLNQAREASARALDIAQASEHMFSITYANIFAAQMCQFLGEAEEAEEFADTAAVLSGERGYAQWAGQAMVQLGRSWDLAGDSRGFDAIRNGWDAYNSTGAALGGPYVAAWMAESYARRGDLAAAHKVLDNILSTNAANGESYYDAELLRLKGNYTLAQGRARREQGLDYLQAAVDLARAQRAGMLLRRAEASLAAAKKRMKALAEGNREDAGG